MADAFQPKFADLVRNYTTTTGTNDFLLGPAVSGFESFTDACAVGDSFYYSALGVDNPADTEVGRGTLLDGGVISREPIAGNKTNFKSGTKAIALIAAGEWYSQLDSARAGAGPTNVKSFGAVGDGVSDDTAAIQAALDHVESIGGGAIYIPEGRYLISSYLTVHPMMLIRGAGRRASRIVSAHTGGGGATAGEDLRNGSGLVTSSPINSSTPLYVMLEDIAIENSNAANVGAAYYDTGGTYIAGRNVCFGGFKYGVVLDQSELVDFDLCEFGSQNDGGAGVWIVNGQDLTPGSQGLYSNRISIKRCQINQPATVIGIADDGGYVHVFEDNNYNGCLNHIRAAGAILDIRGGEFEGAASHCVNVSSLSLAGVGVGGCKTTVRGGLFIATAGQASIHGANSPGNLHVDGIPVFAGGAGTNPISGAGNFAAMWLLSYANDSQASSVKDRDAQFVNVDAGSGEGFAANGVTCLDGNISASNIGTAASHAATDFLQPANNLGDVSSASSAARNLHSGYVLAQSAAAVSHSGDTNEFTLATVTIPANMLGPNGRVEVKARFSFAGTAGTKTTKTKLGSNALVNVASGTAVANYRHNVEICNANSASAQFYWTEAMNSSGGISSGYGALTVDTASNADISISCALGNASDTIRLESYQVIIYPRA